MAHHWKRSVILPGTKIRGKSGYWGKAHTGKVMAQGEQVSIGVKMFSVPLVGVAAAGSEAWDCPQLCGV